MQEESVGPREDAGGCREKVARRRLEARVHRAKGVGTTGYPEKVAEIVSG